MTITQRQMNQSQRIQHGIDNGQLTQREAVSLRSDQGEIRGFVQQARSDGQIDRQERSAIRQLQNTASRDTYEAKHNDERQPWAPPAPGPITCQPPKPGEPTVPTPIDSIRIDRREARQADRIENGLSRGQLTPEEAQRLVGQQRQIHGTEAEFKADGRLTGAERSELEKLQDAASMAIFLARHNSKNAG